MANSTFKCQVGCPGRIDDEIQCDLCETWLHKSCAAEKDDYLKDILKKGKSTPQFWKCWRCSNLWKNIRNEFVPASEYKVLCMEVQLLKSTVLELQSQIAVSHVSQPTQCKNVPTVPTPEKVNPQRKVKSPRRSNLRRERSPKMAIGRPTIPDEIRIKKNTETLVLGDSLMRGTFRGEPGVHVRFFPGVTSDALAKKILATKIPEDEVAPKVVILHAGSNNLSRNKNIDNVLGDHWFLVETVKQKFPLARIIVSGVLHRKDVPVKAVVDLNKSLAWMCSCLEVAFTDLTAFFNPTHYTRDGIHLNHMGTSILENALKNYSSCLARSG